MKAKPTRTLNPLPFHDLEPKRFEDLIRQLAYDLRTWKSLEATGRGGSDDGMDIRGIEVVLAAEPTDDPDSEEQPDQSERLWIFQCKREQKFSAGKIKKAVQESLKSLNSPPHGFVLAVACDVSKKARDAFREEMVARKIEEFSIWAKGELEDMLFQAKNDRLLFAYFGISLQPRRQSTTTALRSRIAKKKQLKALIEEDDNTESDMVVLLRDPTDERYPNKPPPNDPPARWGLCRAISVKDPECLQVLRAEHIAAVSPDGKQWDAITEVNAGEALFRAEIQSMGFYHQYEREDEQLSLARSYWSQYIPERERATLKVYRQVPFDRILAVDPIGDRHYPVPHILVESDPKTGPFTTGHYLELVPTSTFARPFDIVLSDKTRTEIFPDPLPPENAPAPSTVDQTSAKPAPLTKTSADTLSSILSGLTVRKQKLVEQRKQGSRNHQTMPSDPRFRTWLEKVAHPVFSEFAKNLQKSGHNSWVTFRPIDGSATTHDVELIEIHFKLDTGGTVYNSAYRPSGYFKVSKNHQSILIEAYPKENQNHHQNPQPKFEDLTREYLEKQILNTLDRLQRDQF